MGTNRDAMTSWTWIEWAVGNRKSKINSNWINDEFGL